MRNFKEQPASPTTLVHLFGNHKLQDYTILLSVFGISFSTINTLRD